MRTRETALLAIAAVFSAATVALATGLGVNAVLSPSLNSLLGVAVGALMMLPVRYIYRNIENLEDELTGKAEEERGTLLLTVLAFSLSTSSFVYGYSFPAAFVLNLPFQSSYQIFLPVRQLYSGLVPGLSGLLFDFGRLYLQAIWLYLLAGLVTDGYSKLVEAGENSLRAGLLPFTGNGDGVPVEIYVVTGWHGIFRIPESFCRECNMFVRSAEEAAEQVDFEVDVNVKSFWTRFPRALLKGGYHAPVMLVDGELVAQGYDVPNASRVKEALENSR